MNKKQQLEKLGNQLNETFKQYVELAIQVEIEEQIERTLNDLIDKLEKISNGEEIVEGLTANHKPKPTVIDMLMRYKNFLEEIETSDSEDAEDDEEYEDDVIHRCLRERSLKDDFKKDFSINPYEFFLDVSEKDFKDFLQSLKKIGLLK